MIFRCSNIVVMMPSCTHIGQITASSCCGSCCYQDRKWALTFEVTFKVWLQHQSCQHHSRGDICFCSSAKKKSVGFYGSSIVKVKEDIYFSFGPNVSAKGAVTMMSSLDLAKSYVHRHNRVVRSMTLHKIEFRKRKWNPL